MAPDPQIYMGWLSCITYLLQAQGHGSPAPAPSVPDREPSSPAPPVFSAAQSWLHSLMAAGQKMSVKQEESKKGMEKNPAKLNNNRTIPMAAKWNACNNTETEPKQSCV